MSLQQQFVEGSMIGGYNPTKRLAAASLNLEDELDKIDSEFQEWLHQSKVQARKDASVLYLEWKVEEVKQQEGEIQKFENPDQHFTKQYRTIQGHCGKLQNDLDNIDVIGRDDLRSMRKDALLIIDRMIKNLAGKAHADGKICSRCQVRE